jgi:hypothetical protein
LYNELRQQKYKEYIIEAIIFLTSLKDKVSDYFLPTGLETVEEINNLLNDVILSLPEDKLINHIKVHWLYNLKKIVSSQRNLLSYYNFIWDLLKREEN